MSDNTNTPNNASNNNASGNEVGNHFWQQRTRRVIVPLAIGALGIAALGVGQYQWVKHDVEKDLDKRVTQALRDAGYPSLNVEFDGRDAKLDGEVVNPRDVQRALEIVRDQEGVRNAEEDVEVNLAGPSAPVTPTVDATGPIVSPSGKEPDPTRSVSSQPLPSVTVTAVEPSNAAPQPPEPTETKAPETAPARPTAAGTVVETPKPEQPEPTAATSQPEPTVSQTRTVQPAKTSPAPAKTSPAPEPTTAQPVPTKTTTAKPVPTKPATPSVSKTSSAKPSASPSRTRSVAPTAQPGSPSEPQRPQPVPEAVRQQILSLPAIHFEHGYLQPTPGSRPAIQKLAQILKVNPDVVITLVGHTDSTGTKSLNQRLSIARAAEVKKLLVTYGVAEARIKTAGLGESRPKATNANPAGRAINRRVDINYSK